MDWEDGLRRDGHYLGGGPPAPQAAPGPAPAAGGPAYAAVDADVPEAVRARLASFLAHRAGWAEALDETFAHDVVARLERFALGGGKRLRPQLLWWSLRGRARPGDARTRGALGLCAALELLQCCALIHDDVMDGDLVRRGEPALHAAVSGQYAPLAAGGGHRRLGESAAILAGDLALAWADDMVGELELPAPLARDVRSVWAVMRTEMVAGQYLDMHGEITGTRSLARAVRAACLKSALYTVERPLQLGALLADADARTTTALRSAGRCAGLAFQLHDDVRDLFSGLDGRPPGQDVRVGKPTYLMAVALARAEATGDTAAREVFGREVGRAGLDADGLRAVREAVTSTGAHRIVTRRIARLLDMAHRHLDRAALDPDGHRRLAALMESAAGRSPTTLPGDSAAPSPPGTRAAVIEEVS
ncbi:polyprenyl synthetase family protein [Streptomyces sp. NPDC006711]|uniref:polyprenyl synthetase family protein n=1 Tax=Streptomyces sp. NPDC006711 TaxID=3364762 RepID=UPI0036B31E71